MYFRKHYNIIGREIIYNHHSTLANHTISLIIYFLFFLLPATTTGCSDNAPTEGSSICTISHCKNAGVYSAQGSALDILIFEDDRLRRLDAYMRIEDYVSGIVTPSSTGGEKIYFICINSGKDKYGWADICSYSSLGKITFDLENEDRDALVMTGEHRGIAGIDIETLSLKPIASSVQIGSLRCDLSGTPYAGKRIKDVRAYLTNVNATCSLTGVPSKGQTRLINQEMLCEYDLKYFKDRTLIVQEIAAELGKTALRTEKSFLCYPNYGDRTRSTRLVIEGKIEGIVYYWPIEICPDEGIGRNMSYNLGITIRRRGTTDPNCLVDPTAVDLNLKTKPWMEKEEYQIRF